MNILQAIILGIVEGVTEFLPISSTGHLTIVEKLMGLPLDDAGVTAFTAIIQTGAILAVISSSSGETSPRWPQRGSAGSGTEQHGPRRITGWPGR